MRPARITMSVPFCAPILSPLWEQLLLCPQGTLRSSPMKYVPARALLSLNSSSLEEPPNPVWPQHEGNALSWHREDRKASVPAPL